MIGFARLAAVLAPVVFAAPSSAADYEKAPSFLVARLLGAKAAGPNYTIISPVLSDGTLRDYTIATRYGALRVSGDEMLSMRLKELAALDALEKVSRSSAFGDALVKAGLKPAEFVGNLVTAPGATLNNTMEGVSHLLGGVVSGVRNLGKSQDRFLESVTGAAAARREIAYAYGVDPYTDYQPLSNELDSLSRASALGGLTVSAALIAVPGAAGTIVSGVSTAKTLSAQARDNSAAQLMDLNRAKLAEDDVASGVAEALLANENFTPVDVAAFADAIGRLGPISNATIIAARAAKADTRDVAFFIRRSVEMAAAYQQRARTITGFVDLGEGAYPSEATKAGGAVSVLAIDCLSWTKDTAAILKAMTEALNGAGVGGAKTLIISGTATPLAMKKLRGLGWDVKERAVK